MEHGNEYIGSGTFRNLVESANGISEATVSKERAYRLAVLKRNAKFIEELKKAIMGGQMQRSHANAPTAELMKRIRSAEAMLKILGEDEYLARRGNQWTNSMGLYVESELNMVSRLIQHHGGPLVPEPRLELKK